MPSPGLETAIRRCLRVTYGSSARPRKKRRNREGVEQASQRLGSHTFLEERKLRRQTSPTQLFLAVCTCTELITRSIFELSQFGQRWTVFSCSESDSRITKECPQSVQR